MTDTTMTLPALGSDEDVDGEAGWSPVIIWYPRVEFCDTHMGLRRRLLLPGVRRVRMSRRLNRRIYRR